MNNSELIGLKKEYEDNIQNLQMEICSFIEENSSDGEEKENLKNPFTLGVILRDPEDFIAHAYNIGKLDIYRKVLVDIDYLIAYENQKEDEN
jgi:hypothetical protein